MNNQSDIQKNVQYKNEQIESLLTTAINIEKPQLQWKQAMLLSMKKNISQHVRTQRHGFRKFIFLLGIPSVGVVTMILLFLQMQRNFVEVETENNHSEERASSPIYIADEWTRTHVQYHFVDEIELPTAFSVVEYEYAPINREFLDVLVRQLDQTLFSGEITTDDQYHSITYTANGKLFSAWQDQSQFSYELFAAPKESEFIKQDKKRLTWEEQVTIVNDLIMSHPEVVFHKPYELLSLHGKTEVTVRVKLSEKQYIDVYHIRFYNGKLWNIWGNLITNIHENTLPNTHGSTKEIEAFLNMNPPFILHSNFPDEAYVQYNITDYRFLKQQNSTQLELKYELQNPKKTFHALGLEYTSFNDVDVISGWMVVPSADQRAVETKIIEKQLKAKPSK
ncbi:MAG TPA: hypothetical protein VJB65_03825 [Patescibacteria group bacterium]|nr:hypothetical protein [Patescibacteria group bacterium]